MKNKDITYKYFQRLVKDKDCSVNMFIETTLNKTQAMFIYSGLPPTLPASELENLLQCNGFAFVTKINGNLYALEGGLGGKCNAYYKPIEITVANPWLDVNKTFNVETDGVLIKNDYFANGLLPIIGKYAVLLTDCGISLNLAAVLSRIVMLLSASDDKTQKSCELFLQKILDGEFSVIGENAFLKGATAQNVSNATSSVLITHLIELNQYYKGSLLNAIGLQSNYNMKRERLSETEILLNSDDLLPFVSQMLTLRQDGVKRINEMYGTEITVDLATSWKTEKETNDRAAEIENTVTAAENETASPENVSNETDGTADTVETMVTTETTQTDTETAETVSRETDEEETQKIVNLIREIRENE